MYYNELKMYCKSEGLSEYLLSEMRTVAPRKGEAPAKGKKPLTDKKATDSLKRVVC
jgi:hypothetical protein